MERFDSVCVLGGAGLVGYQVCRELLRQGVTNEVAVVSLRLGEVERAVARLREEYPSATIVGRYGNVFARGTLADIDGEEREPVRDRTDPKRRRALLADIYEDFDVARAESALCRLVRETRPAAVVDCINTATAISYQDVPSTAKQLMAALGMRGDVQATDEQLRADVETMLVSIEIPQLILHVRLLHDALTEVGARAYLKVGTTGTGGMGLNIPYTHGEDKPSPTLMAKTAVAFAHTGLLFLAARTEGGPTYKELKPAAMIGYREVAVREVPGYVWEKQGTRFVKRRAQARPLFQAQTASLTEPLDTTPDPSRYSTREDDSGEARTVRLACVNTGENGWFTHGEFEAITAHSQMEIITPEEIALASVQELTGRSTGRDVVAALDSSILGPTYKGGLLRQVALDRIALLEGEGSVPSVALGDLGPPQLSKYLFELYLMRAAYETLEATAIGLRSADAGQHLEETLKARPDLRDAIVSVGIPILKSDGHTILRGPEIKIPGYDPSVGPRPPEPDEIDAWAQKGWVDLRLDSLHAWADRLDRVVASRRGGSAGGSDSMSPATYGRDDFRVGEVVAWVFANEPGFRGFRIK